MRKVNDSVLNNVLSYIKDFQLKEGRSPSFRQITHAFNFKSISSAQRYVRILQERGQIEKTSIGKIAIPCNLQRGQTIVAPLVGSVACGNPILAEQNIESNYQLPTAIFGNSQLYALRAKGDSMINAGIFDGDLIFYRPTNDADDGEIVVALIEDSATVKRLHKKKDYIILHPENTKYKDIITKEATIQGVVKHVIHSF